MKIRVLHIVGIMNMGGLENFIMSVYRKIDREKIQFDFLVTREEEGIFDDEIRALGGKIYNIPHMSKVGYFKYQKILFKFFKQHPEYSIVHVHRDALCSIYLKQAKKAGVKIRIAHSHTIQLAQHRSIKDMIVLIIKKYAMFFTKFAATEYFACSKDAGRWLFGKNPDKKVKVIKNGIDTKKYIYSQAIRDKVRKELDIDENTFIIGHVGRFNSEKNHEFLIDLASQLKKDKLDFKLLLVGEGELLLKIKNKAKSLNLEKEVVFLGIRNDVNKLMMAFDVFVFPSQFEGLGIVMIEAQTTGLNCIASEGVPVEADMNLGLVNYFSVDSIMSWKNKIKELINKKDEIRINRFSNQSLIIEKGYDIETTSKYLQDFYLNKI